MRSILLKKCNPASLCLHICVWHSPNISSVTAYICSTVRNLTLMSKALCMSVGHWQPLCFAVAVMCLWRLSRRCYFLNKRPTTLYGTQDLSLNVWLSLYRVAVAMLSANGVLRMVLAGFIFVYCTTDVPNWPLTGFKSLKEIILGALAFRSIAGLLPFLLIFALFGTEILYFIIYPAEHCFV